MEIESKKAIFTSDQIIIKKRKKNIVIPLDKVDRMLYAKFTIKNYFIIFFFEYISIALTICFLLSK